MATKLIRTIVTDTEARARVIRDFCRNGSAVQLRREHVGHHDANAIAVWIECRRFLGLYKAQRQIGYIGGDLLNRLAMALDKGAIQIRRAYVHSLYAPHGRNEARISLAIECDELLDTHGLLSWPPRPAAESPRVQAVTTRPGHDPLPRRGEGRVRMLICALSSEEAQSLRRLATGMSRDPVPAAHLQKFLRRRLARRTAAGIVITAFGRAHLDAPEHDVIQASAAGR
jgi:hypothetical protein